MSEALVRVCDTANCRRLADTACAICDQDVCTGHASGAIKMNVFILCPASNEGVHNLRSVEMRLCGSCATLLTTDSDDGPGSLAYEALQPVVDAVASPLHTAAKAIWAQRALLQQKKED